jgi:hypothetical protein
VRTVFLLDMNGAAGSSKSQVSRAGQPDRIKVPTGRRYL